MELTQEYFDQVVQGLATKSDLEGLATKQDLTQGLAGTEARLITRIDQAQEELARMVAEGFEDMQHRLDVTDRMQKLEAQMKELRAGLHLGN
jgi:hypothetical protein